MFSNLGIEGNSLGNKKLNKSYTDIRNKTVLGKYRKHQLQKKAKVIWQF